jgi:hypothetical protein
MFDNLTGLGYGLIAFAIIIGVGTVMLANFGGSVGCPPPYVYNSSAGTCHEVGNASNTAPLSGVAYTNTNYLTEQLGQSGLAGWTPAIIAFSVGMLFLGAFFIKKGRKY